MEALAVLMSVVALADRRPQLYSHRTSLFDEDFIDQILPVLEHFSNLADEVYKGEEITLHGSKSIGARLAHLIGMTEGELASLLVRTMRVERESMFFGSLWLFVIFKALGLDAETSAIRNAADYTPSVAMVKSLKIQPRRRGYSVDSEQKLYDAQSMCVKLWFYTLNRQECNPSHAAQAIRDGMILWFGDFTKSPLLQEEDGECPPGDRTAVEADSFASSIIHGPHHDYVAGNRIETRHVHRCSRTGDASDGVLPSSLGATVTRRPYL